MKINTLFNIPGSKKTKKRVGRGIGSGKGKTCGRGHKGQKSRSGVAIKTEGGQMPIIKRLPKRGFNSLNPKSYKVVNVADIDALITAKKIDPSKTINKEILVNVGVINNVKVPVKLLGNVKEFNHNISLQLDACSKSAKSIVEKAGGKIL